MEIITSLIFLLILIPLCIGGISMAPWVPTRKKDISRLLEVLNLQEGGKFLEIGCGDGRVSYSVAKEHKGASILGIEIAFPVFVFAYVRGKLGSCDNYKVRLGNAFKQDFSSFDAVYVYGMPDKMGAKIVPKFLSEAKVGAKLYSYVFSIPEEYKNSVISYGSEDEAKIHILEKK